MNDLFIEMLTNNQNGNVYRESYIELEFLGEFGDGKNENDEIIKNLTFTCEEGIDYTEI